MNDEKDRDLQRLFAAYAPTLPEEPFLEHTRTALTRQLKLARARSVAGYAVLGLAGAAVAAMTAAPLSRICFAVEKTIASAGIDLPPPASQALVYGVTVVVLILGRRRIRAFLGPW